MSTELTWQTTSSGSEQTMALGREIGQRFKGGEVIELMSDLGGGKTTLVRGLAAGVAAADDARSPSFTLHNQYRGRGLTIHHFDFYRLFEAGEMRDELAEVLQDPHNVAVIEWGQAVADVLPKTRLRIQITVTGDNARTLQCTYPQQLSYLLPVNT